MRQIDPSQQQIVVAAPGLASSVHTVGTTSKKLSTVRESQSQQQIATPFDEEKETVGEDDFMRDRSEEVLHLEPPVRFVERKATMNNVLVEA